jgi:hypothetical protein
VTMRMPTLLPFGEGCMGGEAIDTRTRSIRRVGRRYCHLPTITIVIFRRLPRHSSASGVPGV